MRVEKIISSNVSPSPRAYQGPSAVMRSSTSAAGVSGEAAKRQEQCGQKSSTCMANLLICSRAITFLARRLQVRYQLRRVKLDFWSNQNKWWQFQELRKHREKRKCGARADRGAV